MNELELLSIVIPARDEEGCIASTVHQLNLELRLRGVPHEIVVVDEEEEQVEIHEHTSPNTSTFDSMLDLFILVHASRTRSYFEQDERGAHLMLRRELHLDQYFVVIKQIELAEDMRGLGIWTKLAKAFVELNINVMVQCVVNARWLTHLRCSGWVDVPNCPTSVAMLHDV